MQTKFDIGDFVLVPFKVQEINVTNKDTIKYNLIEISGNRRGMDLLNKEENELVKANFKEDYDVESCAHKLKCYRIVDAEEKKGEWEEVPMGDYILLFRCSNRLQKSSMKSKYCPYCGAKMKEEVNGND